MSFLIEDTDICLFKQLNLCSADKSTVFTQIQEKNIIMEPTLELLPKYLNNPNFTLFQYTSALKSTLFRYYTTIASIHLNLGTLTLKMHLKLLNYEQNYFKIQGNEKMKILYKSLNKMIRDKEFNIKIGTARGDLTICSPNFYFLQELKSEKLVKLVQKQLRNIKKNLKLNFQSLDSIFQICQEKRFQLKNPYFIKTEFKDFLKNYHFLRIMNLQLCFASEAKVKEQDLNNRWKRQKQSIKNIKNSIVPIQSETHCLLLYHYSLLNEFQDLQVFDHSLRIVEESRNNISQKIQLPSIPKQKGTQQNFYVLNYVLTNDIYSLKKCRMINKGGFTEIYLTELVYWYIGSYGVGTASQISSITSRPPLKKYVIVKRQNKQLIKNGQRSRVDHEKYILKQIKNGISLFLCKYYIADKNPQLKDDLLSDYIDYPNLNDYCKRYGYTMSFHTKIYFAILIAQSLRYLQQYKIVHLDLKPSNIMTTKRLSIKIIDFGESYHPEMGKHNPGFSMPYSAPENYSKQSSFTFKNDVFSLGVIMFQIFFGRQPFFFYSQKLQFKTYASGNYYDYLFFCSEQSKIVGQPVVLPLILAIISKCLHSDPKNRPELQWIVFILRQCLNYIY